jgi:hypothetical protein
MKMRKSILIVYSICLILLSFFNYSCKEDNPVTPYTGPYQFDSARYTWTTDTILNQYSGLVFGLDTSHVYIIGTHSLTFFDGKNYTRHSYGDLYFNAIDGFEPMHIYIAGAYPNGDNRLMKWDGSIYQDIPVPGDTSLRGGLTAVYAKSPNEIWLGSIDKIFFSNGSICIEYEIDSAFGITAFAEFNGKILAIGRRSYGIINSDVEISVYQFEDGTWTRIYLKRFHYYEKLLIPVKLGNELYGCLDGLLKFNGLDFYKILESPSGFRMGYIVAGETDNEFLTLFSGDNEIFYTIWKENKWSREIYLVSPQDMKKIDRNYYILESPCSSCNFVLLRIGRPN